MVFYCCAEAGYLLVQVRAYLISGSRWSMHFQMAVMSGNVASDVRAKRWCCRSVPEPLLLASLRWWLTNKGAAWCVPACMKAIWGRGCTAAQRGLSCVFRSVHWWAQLINNCPWRALRTPWAASDLEQRMRAVAVGRQQHAPGESVGCTYVLTALVWNCYTLACCVARTRALPCCSAWCA